MYRVVLNQLSRVLTMLFVYYSCNRVSLARFVPINRNHLLVQWNLYNPGLLGRLHCIWIGSVCARINESKLNISSSIISLGSPCLALS